jgi:hypothetical protein
MLDHLPERDRAIVKRRLRRARAESDHAGRSSSSGSSPRELDRTHPGAAASLREGLEEALTLTRLWITGSLKRTLESTNPCASMIECVRRNPAATSGTGRTARWRCAGRPPGCSKPSRSSAGSSATATWPSSPSRSSSTSPPTVSQARPARRPLGSSPPDHHTGTAVAKFHDEREILHEHGGRPAKRRPLVLTTLDGRRGNMGCLAEPAEGTLLMPESLVGSPLFLLRDQLRGHNRRSSLAGCRVQSSQNSKRSGP